MASSTLLPVPTLAHSLRSLLISPTSYHMLFTFKMLENGCVSFESDFASYLTRCSTTASSGSFKNQCLVVFLHLPALTTSVQFGLLLARAAPISPPPAVMSPLCTLSASAEWHLHGVLVELSAFQPDLPLLPGPFMLCKLHCVVCKMTNWT